MHEVRQAEEAVLGTNSGVKIGLVISLLGLCAGGLGAWVWWAATISAKLDNIILTQTAQATVQTKMGADVEELKAWRKLVDTVGSGPVQSIKDEVKVIKNELELHKAKSP